MKSKRSSLWEVCTETCVKLENMLCGLCTHVVWVWKHLWRWKWGWVASSREWMGTWASRYPVVFIRIQSKHHKRNMCRVCHISYAWGVHCTSGQSDAGSGTSVQQASWGPRAGWMAHVGSLAGRVGVGAVGAASLPACFSFPSPSTRHSPHRTGPSALVPLCSALWVWVVIPLRVVKLGGTCGHSDLPWGVWGWPPGCHLDTSPGTPILHSVALPSMGHVFCGPAFPRTCVPRPWVCDLCSSDLVFLWPCIYMALILWPSVPWPWVCGLCFCGPAFPWPLFCGPVALSVVDDSCTPLTLHHRVSIWPQILYVLSNIF